MAQGLTLGAFWSRTPYYPRDVFWIDGLKVTLI